MREETGLPRFAVQGFLRSPVSSLLGFNCSTAASPGWATSHCSLETANTVWKSHPGAL